MYRSLLRVRILWVQQKITCNIPYRIHGTVIFTYYTFTIRFQAIHGSVNILFVPWIRNGFSGSIKQKVICWGWCFTEIYHGNSPLKTTIYGIWMELFPTTFTANPCLQPEDKFQPSARFPGSPPGHLFFCPVGFRTTIIFAEVKNHHPKGSKPLLRKQPKNNKKQQRKRQQKNAGCRLPGVKTHRTTTTKKKQVRGFPWKKRSGRRVAQPPSAFGALIALGQHRPWSPRPRPPRRIQGAEINLRPSPAGWFKVNLR